MFFVLFYILYSKLRGKTSKEKYNPHSFRSFTFMRQHRNVQRIYFINIFFVEIQRAVRLLQIQQGGSDPAVAAAADSLGKVLSSKLFFALLG